MAQVRKFQSGGKTFKIAGYTFDTSNADDMKLFQELASDSNLGGIAQSVLDNVNDNAYSGTLNMYRTADGKVVSEGELQHIKDKHMSAGTQKATSRKDTAFWNAVKRRSGREWANDMDAFISEVARRKATDTSTPSGDNKIKITGVGNINGGKWGYNEQGWNEADINNAAMMKEWQLLEDYFNASEEDRKNKYDVSGLDNRALEAYINMRQNNPKLYEQYKSKFIGNAEKIADNDDFYSTYGWFGFTPGSTEEIAAAKTTEDNKVLKEYLATQGLDFDGAENVFYRDKDGNLMVTDAFLTNVLGGDRNGHYWLNDNWANLKDEQGNSNPYSQMRNHIIWNSRVYKQDDAAVLAELQKSGYIDANKAYDAARAEQIMRTQWSDNPTFAHEAYDPETRYSEWAHGYKDNGLRYRTLESNLGKGKSLVGYYTNDDPTDNYGFRTERFAIIGDDGKLIEDNVDPSSIAKKNNGLYVPGTTYFMTERLGQNAGALAGTYINGTAIDGKPSNTFFYKNPTTGEFFIQDPDLKGKQKGKAVRIPTEIASMIPEEAWEYFRTDKSAKDRLFGYLKNFTNTGWGKFWNQGDGLFGARNIALRNDFRRAGLSKEQAEQIVRLLNEWGTNKKYREATGKHDASSIARQQVFLANPQTEDIAQPAFKEGGKIEKHQYGNVLGQQGKTELKTINLQESDRKDANTNQSFGLGSKDSKQWSSLDTAELLATVGDLSSLALSFVPGAHLGAAGVGGAASTVQFVTDIKRDGFQGKDALNYLANLGFDTMSGFTGAGGKVAKIMKNFPKTAQILQKAIKAGAIVGVGDAVYNTIDKIAKGESFTLSDVRRIANGVAGGVTLGKTGLFNQTKGKRVKTDASIIKGKKAETPEIKIDAKKIEAASKADQLIELQSQVTAGYRAKNKGTKLTDDQILELYDIPTKKTTDFKWKVWKSSREVVPDLKSKSTRSTLSETELDDLAAKRNGFQNWFFGTGKGQRMYNKFLTTGETPTFEHDIRLGKWYQGVNASPDGAVATRGGWYRHTPQWEKPIHLVHRLPNNGSFFRLHTPNFGSHQQFPQEMEFTENISTIPMKRLVFKKGGVLKVQLGTKIAKSSSARPSKKDFNWAGLGSDLLEVGNAARALKESRQIYDIDRKMAEITGRRTIKAPNIITNRRFVTPTVNQYNDLIGKYNTSIGQNITSDAFANMAARLSGADKVAEMTNNMNREISAEFNNAQDKWNQTWQQQQLYNTDAANQNNQIQVSAALAGEQAKAGKLTRDSDIYNKYLNKAQYQLNNIASVDSQLQGQKYKLGVARASALAQNPNADVNGFDSMLSEINKPEFRDYLLNGRRFGITSAAKGTKLRSTNDEMLLNNQKLVARAIEKLNDNTMKLILKALS